jgi:hypothetical protein
MHGIVVGTKFDATTAVDTQQYFSRGTYAEIVYYAHTHIHTCVLYF